MVTESKAKKRAYIHRHVQSDLGVRGEQQFLLQDEEVLVQIDHVLLQACTS